MMANAQAGELYTLDGSGRQCSRYFRGVPSELHCSRAGNSSQTRQKTTRLQIILKRHIFLPVSIETVGSWSQHAIELVQEIEWRTSGTTVITEDSRESYHLPVSEAPSLCRGRKAVSFLGTFLQDYSQLLLQSFYNFRVSHFQFVE